ncbi:MAG: MaoC family dehydratase [Rhodococcus sp. (in: high G+C Gram-positive bacteria)]|nr:MAG: MaoC family dehydratase [Rhodococcus sp. (in: high G+C Gram-positive bacteria)]
MASLDPGVIGTRIPEHTVEVERGRLSFFARATGQDDPIYTDPSAAAEAGHRDLPVPPTFLFCLDHFSTEVTDCYAKKGGALQFLVRTTEVTRHGEPIAQLRSTTVIRDPRASA